jgi:hypothetical protein
MEISREHKLRAVDASSIKKVGTTDRASGIDRPW